MKIHIVEKLQKFLVERPNLKEECEVVYLMIELRKILDHEGNSGESSLYPLVRFHADWIAHTTKDHITHEIKEIMEDIDNSIDIHPKDGNIEFLLLPEFRSELLKLLGKYDLPNEFCKDDGNWLTFMLALTQVLADQPILDPTDNIEKFYYVDMGEEGIMATIDFKGVKLGGSITLGIGL